MVSEFSAVSSCLAPYTAVYMAWVGKSNSCESFCRLKVLIMPCGRLPNMCVSRAICYLQFNREHDLATESLFVQRRAHTVFTGCSEVSGTHIFLVLEETNSFTTPFPRGSCLATCFLRLCIKIKCPRVTTCSLHIRVARGQVFNKFSSLRKKRKSMLLVFLCLYAKCI